MQQTKTRNSNLELYRILVMWVIVVHHYVVNSGLLGELALNPTSTASLFCYLAGGGGKTGINCFVLITGYFMCKSDITLHKFLKLVLQVLFYNVVIAAIFALTGYHTYSLGEAAKLLLPVRSMSDGFTSCFLLFFLCIPFLNILIRHLNQMQHLKLLLLLLFGYSFLAFPPFSMPVTFNYVSWFGMLYILSSYIRLYPLKQDGNVKLWFVLTLISMLVGVASVLYLIKKGNPFPYHYISDSNQLISLWMAVSSFMLFKNLRVPQSRIINTLGAATFGVLLIHANSDVMRTWLWKDVVDCVGHYHAAYNEVYMLASVTAIFLACAGIDYLRKRFIEDKMLALADRGVETLKKQDLFKRVKNSI